MTEENDVDHLHRVLSELDPSGREENAEVQRLSARGVIRTMYATATRAQQDEIDRLSVQQGIPATASEQRKIDRLVAQTD